MPTLLEFGFMIQSRAKKSLGWLTYRLKDICWEIGFWGMHSHARMQPLHINLVWGYLWDGIYITMKKWTTVSKPLIIFRFSAWVFTVVFAPDSGFTFSNELIRNSHVQNINRNDGCNSLIVTRIPHSPRCKHTRFNCDLIVNSSSSGADDERCHPSVSQLDKMFTARLSAKQ